MIRILLAASIVASGCAVESSGICETDADCINGGTCVDGLCTGGEVPTASFVATDEVDLGAQVALDGAASAKAGGGADGLAFAWKVTANGADVTVEAGNTASALFQANIPHATYKVDLVVSDRGTPSAVATKEVKVRNSKPVARFTSAPEEWPRSGSITLDASTSTDADGDALTYEWALVKDPVTAVGAVTGTGATATLTTGAEAATYTVSVTVSDGTASDKATVTQQIINKRPVVDPGAAQTVTHACSGSPKTCQANVTLSGTVTDPDGTIDEDTIVWSLKAAPTASAATVTPTPTGEPRNVAFRISNAATDPIAGAYEFELKAKDNDGEETKATVIVTVGNEPPVLVLNGGTTPISVDHSFSAANFNATVAVTATVTDPEGDDVTVTFEDITTELPGATVTQGTPTATGTTYTIKVAQANPTSLIGAAPLYTVKARVLDRNAGEAAVEVPVEIKNRVPAQTAFGGAAIVATQHTYGAAAAPLPTAAGYWHKFPGLTFNATDADNDPLTATWTVSGGPAGTVVARTVGTDIKPTELGFYSTNAGIVTATLTATQTVSDPFGNVVGTKQFKFGNRAPTTNLADRADGGHVYNANVAAADWRGAGNFYGQSFAGATTVTDPDGDPVTAAWSASSAALPAAEQKFRIQGTTTALTAIDIFSTNKAVVGATFAVKATLNDGFGAVDVTKNFRMGNRAPTFASFSAGATTVYSGNGTGSGCLGTCLRCFIGMDRTYTTFNAPGSAYRPTLAAKVDDLDGDPITVNYNGSFPTNQFKGNTQATCTAGQPCPSITGTQLGEAICTGTLVEVRTIVEVGSISAQATDGFVTAQSNSQNVDIRPNCPPMQICNIIELPN